MHDILVIGTGAAGLAAAREALRCGLSTVTMEALFSGGLVTNINHLDGEIQGSGSDLAADLSAEIAGLGAQALTETARSMALEGDAVVVESDEGRHRARAVVVASGATLRRLGVPGETEFEGRGVSQCANCDGPFFTGQEVVVVGGGDAALQEALALTEYAKRVHLVHRGSGFRAKQHFANRVAAHGRITIHWQTEVQAVLGDQAVSAVRVRRATGGEDEIPCAGFFAYVGLEPACAFVPDAVARDAGGRLVTDAGLKTAMPGVYAAGAVRSGYGGLLKQALAEGQAAAKAVAAALRS